MMTVKINELRPLPASTDNLTTSTYPTVKLFPYTIVVTRSNRKNYIKTGEKRKENKMAKKKMEKKIRITQAMKQTTDEGEVVKY